MRVVAFDGKTLRGSFDKFTDTRPAHLVSAFAADSALVLGHLEIDDKSNEIPAVQRLLGELGLANSVVTVDALHCQKKTFERAAERSLRLIAQVKANQPTLFGDVQRLCDEREPLDRHETIDAARARHETRHVEVFDAGTHCRGMLERLARESGVETPTAEDLARLDRKRKGKKLSNKDWVSGSDPEAKIAKMKDGTTHLAYKPGHAVDLDTGAVVAAELHPADEGDTTTLPKTLAAAEENLEAVDAAPTAEDPAECVTDKGYHSRSVLKALDDGPWKTRISEPKQKGFARWRGDEAARRAVANDRTRLLSGVAREAFKPHAEIVERSFAHNLDRGGMRRTWLRGR